MTDNTQFILKIKIGSESTENPSGVAALLRKAAAKIEDEDSITSGKIMDYNGNTVGAYGEYCDP